MPHDHASTHFTLPEQLAQHVMDFHVDPQHLLEREKTPHVTIKYGLNTTGKDAAAALRDERPAKLSFGGTSLFHKPEADILKLDVWSADLHRLHRKLNRLPHGDAHPEFKPHLTIAYLRTGTGKLYAGKNLRYLTGRSATFRDVTFSAKDGTKRTIPLL